MEYFYLCYFHLYAANLIKAGGLKITINTPISFPGRYMMNDIIKKSIFFISTVIIVHLIFSGIIRPEVNMIIEAAKNTQSSIPRNFYIIVKDLNKKFVLFFCFGGLF